MFSQLDKKNPKTIINFVQQSWTNRYRLKYDLERQWYLNIAWLAGKQNFIWNDAAKQLNEPPAPPWRVRMVINLISPQIRTYLAKLYKPQIEWDVLPATADSEDAQIAELDKSVLKNYWSTLKMTEKFLDLLEWMVYTGSAFGKVCYDPDLGEELLVTPQDLAEENYSEGTPQFDEYNKYLRKKFKSKFKTEDDYKYIKLGDVDLRVVSPFDIVIDPLALHMRDAKWLIETSVDYIDNIKAKWGVDVKAESLNNSGYTNFANKLRNISTRGSTVETVANDVAYVHQLWIKPCEKFPNGAEYILCQNKVLKEGDNPYSHRKIPYVYFGEIPVKGRFWCTSTVEQLIPSQANYNRTKSQLIENRNLMSRPKWLVPKTAKIANNAITSEPGEVIEYNPAGGKPEQIAAPGIPSYVENMLIQDRADLEDISGVHEVSKAQAPGEVRSGRGILALIEQDETRIGPQYVKLDSCLEELGSLVLSTAAQYVKEERIAKMLGEDDSLNIFGWNGQQLIGKNYGRPGVNYFDVRVKSLAGLPNSRAAQMELLETLMNNGVLNPETDRELIFKLINIGQVNKQLDKARTHRTKALQENLILAQGQEVPVFVWQDHKAHLEILDEFRCSSKYEILPDEIKQLFLLHEQKHKEAIALKTAEPEVLLRKAVNKLMMVHGVIGNEEPQQGNGVQQTAGQPSQGA